MCNGWLCGMAVRGSGWLLCCGVSNFLIFLRCVRVNVVDDGRSVEMSLGYGDVGAFGGDGSCAVCLVAGGSVGCGHRACISANDAEAVVFANHEGADPGCGAVVAIAASGGVPSASASASVGR